MNTRITYHTSRQRLEGWEHFWAKRVCTFQPQFHCTHCLEGQWLGKWINLKMIVNTPVPLSLAEGDVIYVCGVSSFEPEYVWANNFHFPARIKAGAWCELSAYNGDRVTLENAELIPFDDAAARKLYPKRHSSFLTCRNFQFGAHCTLHGIPLSPWKKGEMPAKKDEPTLF